jgi:hypothetical protein
VLKYVVEFVCKIRSVLDVPGAIRRNPGRMVLNENPTTPVVLRSTAIGATLGDDPNHDASTEKPLVNPLSVRRLSELLLLASLLSKNVNVNPPCGLFVSPLITWLVSVPLYSEVENASVCDAITTPPDVPIPTGSGKTDDEGGNGEALAPDVPTVKCVSPNTANTPTPTAPTREDATKEAMKLSSATTGIVLPSSSLLPMLSISARRPATQDRQTDYTRVSLPCNPKKPV